MWKTDIQTFLEILLLLNTINTRANVFWYIGKDLNVINLATRANTRNICQNYNETQVFVTQKQLPSATVDVPDQHLRLNLQ